jgi:hypothetical protein
MGAIAVGPSDAQAALDRVQAGEVLLFRPGCYKRPLRLANRAGTPERPIRLVAEPGAVLDGGRRLEEFNPQAQLIAAVDQLKGRHPPGIQALALDAFLTLDACDHVRVEGFAIEGAWPTAVLVDNCTHVVLRGLDIREGTFAFFLHGERTRRVVIEDCRWLQDVTRGELWRQIAWDRVHGDDLGPDDKRALDGDFVRSYRIRGELVVRRNLVEHAFNGVHCFSRREDPPAGLNEDVLIHDNEFRYVRDNAVEPEDRFRNWWVFRNRIYNCHKWFSIEVERSDLLYLFGNTGWYDEVPGPPDDENKGGGVFKFPKRREEQGRHYVFNNSWYLRSPIAKNYLFSGLLHTNNAIIYGDPDARVFGDLAAAGEEKRFTTRWHELGITFVNDVVHHLSFPDPLRAAGYLVDGGRGEDPRFVDPARADFRLSDGSPCTDTAMPVRIALLDGREVQLQLADIGALQGGRLIELPPGTVPSYEAGPEPSSV